MEPDHLEVEPLSEGPVYNSAAGRRKSVFTESYDPEEDEDDAKPVSGKYPEGCSIKQVFVLDLIKVFILDLNFLAKINKDFN